MQDSNTQTSSNINLCPERNSNLIAKYLAVCVPNKAANVTEFWQHTHKTDNIISWGVMQQCILVQMYLTYETKKHYIPKYHRREELKSHTEDGRVSKVLVQKPRRRMEDCRIVQSIRDLRTVGTVRSHSSLCHFTSFKKKNPGHKSNPNRSGRDCELKNH
jgi:hypothetical protein